MRNPVAPIINSNIAMILTSLQPTTLLDGSITGVALGHRQWDVPFGFAGVQSFFVTYHQRNKMDLCFRLSTQLDLIDKEWPITCPKSGQKSSYLVLKNVATPKEVEKIRQTSHVVVLNDGTMDFILHHDAAVALFEHLINMGSNTENFIKQQLSKCLQVFRMQKRKEFLTESLKKYTHVAICRNNSWSRINIPEQVMTDVESEENSQSVLYKEVVYKNGQHLQLCILSWFECINGIRCLRMALLYENITMDEAICQFSTSPAALYKLATDFITQYKKKPQSVPAKAPRTPQKRRVGAAKKDLTKMMKEYKSRVAKKAKKVLKQAAQQPMMPAVQQPVPPPLIESVTPTSMPSLSMDNAGTAYMPLIEPVTPTSMPSPSLDTAGPAYIRIPQTPVRGQDEPERGVPEALDIYMSDAVDAAGKAKRRLRMNPKSPVWSSPEQQSQGVSSTSTPSMIQGQMESYNLPMLI